MTDPQTPTAPAHEQAQPTIEQLNSRLERAERKLKGLQLTIPGLAVLAAVPIFMHLDKPTAINAKSIVAESFAVQSAKGDIVAQLSADRDGLPSLALLDANKKVRLMAWVGAAGPSVSLLDPQQVSRATLSLNEKSDPSLSLSNADKLTRSVLAIDTTGSGHLVLYGTAGGLDLSAHNGRVRWTPSDGAPVDAVPAPK